MKRFIEISPLPPLDENGRSHKRGVKMTDLYLFGSLSDIHIVDQTGLGLGLGPCALNGIGPCGLVLVFNLVVLFLVLVANPGSLILVLVSNNPFLTNDNHTECQSRLLPLSAYSTI